MIIDVDSHWEAVDYAPGEYPLEPWLDDLPSGVDLLAFGVAGDLLVGTDHRRQHHYAAPA